MLWDTCKTSVSLVSHQPGLIDGLHKPYCGPNNGGDNSACEERIDQLGTTNIGRRSIPTDSMTITLSRSQPSIIHFQACEDQETLPQARVLERGPRPPHISIYPFPFPVCRPPYNKLKNCFPIPVQPTTPQRRIPVYESSPNVTSRTEAGSRRVPTSSFNQLGPIDSFLVLPRGQVVQHIVITLLRRMHSFAPFVDVQKPSNCILSGRCPTNAGFSPTSMV